MNVARMMELRTWAQEHPYQVYMPVYMKQALGADVCGTVMCLAGKTVLEWGTLKDFKGKEIMPIERYVSPNDDPLWVSPEAVVENWPAGGWEYQACRLLDITPEMGKNLFHPVRWDMPYKVRYEYRTDEQGFCRYASWEEKSQVVAEYVLYFIVKYATTEEVEQYLASKSGTPQEFMEAISERTPIVASETGNSGQPEEFRYGELGEVCVTG